MEILKRKILEKRELKGIPSDFLDEFLKEYELKHKKEFDKLKEKKYNEKSKEFDDLKKKIRKKLRELHGVFAKTPLGTEKKKKILHKLKKADKEEEEQIIKEILLAHQSTFERYNFYKELYFQLFEVESQKKQSVKKILDLGCGYNPFSYNFLNQEVEYVAVDINEEDTQFIQDYFNLKNIKGKCLTLDLTNKENLFLIKKESEGSDFCFLLKLLDSLESKKRGSSEELLNHLNSLILVISFPLKTIGGKREIKGERKWFEKIIKNKKYNYKILEIGNEKYYVIKQKNS